MLKTERMEVVQKSETLLHIRFLKNKMLLEVCKKWGTIVGAIGFVWLMDTVAKLHFSDSIFFWLILCSIAVALYSTVEPIQKMINNSYFLFDKERGVIQADRRKDLSIRNIKNVRITVLYGESFYDTEYALTLRTYNANKPYRIDKCGDEEGIKKLAKTISHFLDVPLEIKDRHVPLMRS